MISSITMEKMQRNLSKIYSGFYVANYNRNYGFDFMRVISE